MQFSDRDIRHLESLAMIELDDGSRERFRLQLSRILDFVRHIDRMDMDDGAAGTGTDAEAVAGRGDVPSASLDRSDVLGQAPDAHEGFFSVPPVIDEER